MAAPGDRTNVDIAGRRLVVSNLAKVMYPLVGFTKADVIDYYVRVAPMMLPHIVGRGVTLRRWPDGVTGESFFEKRPPHFPGKPTEALAGFAFYPWWDEPAFG